MYQYFQTAFDKYNSHAAPFLHQQYNEWARTRPFQGLRILHHVPLVQNTLLKIGCLAAAGANITVTNPDFLSPSPAAIAALEHENIRFAPTFDQLINSDFDLYFDCGAACYTALGAPNMGAIELTGTGDNIYQAIAPSCPVISIDKSLTKQLETVFGMAESAMSAITKLTKEPVHDKTWLIFGFGKIGRGIAYLCMQHGYDVSVIDTNQDAVLQAQALGIRAINANDSDAETVIRQAGIIVTATGGYDVLSRYPKNWFAHKILANMGILDEFGPRFNQDEILNAKQPINFVLDDPTPIEYIDAEMYAHNHAALFLLTNEFSRGLHPMNADLDIEIINRWCQYHDKSRHDIERWFIKFDRGLIS